MPNPVKGETLKSFIGRYMGSKESAKTFPDSKQRAAVAYSKFRRKKEKSA